MRKLSIIRPCETNRLDLFMRTNAELVKQLLENGIEYEIVVPTTTITNELESIDNLIVVRYKFKFQSFNPCKAWNYGIRIAKYKSVLFMSPEIMPLEDTIFKLATSSDDNVICQVIDLDNKGAEIMSLVNSGFRSGTPSMFFLAMFSKNDLYRMGGFDERFAGGYAYEDDDFGQRWNRGGNTFVMRDDIKAYHLWHERLQLGIDGFSNQKLFLDNNAKSLVAPKHGLVWEDDC